MEICEVPLLGLSSAQSSFGRESGFDMERINLTIVASLGRTVFKRFDTSLRPMINCSKPKMLKHVVMTVMHTDKMRNHVSL